MIDAKKELQYRLAIRMLEHLSEKGLLSAKELFYPQIGVGKRLDGGRRRVKKYLWSF